MVIRRKDVSFNDYIHQKYPNIRLLDVLKFQKKIEDTNYIVESTENLYIFASYYGTDGKYANFGNEKCVNGIQTYMNKYLMFSNCIFICHRKCCELKDRKNVYFLTPLSKSQNILSAHYLPFLTNIQETQQASDTKTVLGGFLRHEKKFIVQGRIHEKSRDFRQLLCILEHCTNMDFSILLLGYCEMFPQYLEKYKGTKIFILSGLNFQEYHSIFELSIDGLLFLTSLEKTPQYYTDTFTSSISYAIGYGLPCFMDRKLWGIYKIQRSILYNPCDDASIVNGFTKFFHGMYS